MVKVTGIKNGEKLTIFYKDGEYSEEDAKPIQRPPVFGTYYADDELYAFGYLTEYYFDEVIESNCDQKPDWEEGLVY